MNVRKFDQDNSNRLEGYLRYLFNKNIDYTIHVSPDTIENEKGTRKKVLSTKILVVH